MFVENKLMNDKEYIHKQILEWYMVRLNHNDEVYVNTHIEAEENFCNYDKDMIREFIEKLMVKRYRRFAYRKYPFLRSEFPIPGFE